MTSQNCGKDLEPRKDVAWMAQVFPDWTTLQLISGESFAFNRATGRVYKLPDPDCPFIPFRPAI